jgi:hypothetical protein
MASITITFKDGTKREFPHVGRAGGGYTKKVRYEGGFVIVTDEYYNETAFPQSDVREVYKDSGDRGRW